MIILLKKYNMIQISEEKLIFPVTKNNTIKYYAHNEQLFNIIN